MPRRSLTAGRLLVRAAALLIAAILAGCASTTPQARVTPTTPTILHIRGGPMVIPVEVASRPGARVDCRLDDGREPPTTLRWIGVEQTRVDAGYRWLPDPLRWRTWPADAEHPATPAGFWALHIDLPGDAVGQGLWIDDQRVTITWLPDPALAEIDGQPMEWPSPATHEALDSAYLGRLVDPVRQNPLTRWRYRLILDGLRPPSPQSAHEHAFTAFEDPALEALARQTEDLWRAAIARLRQDDPELTRLFTRRLVDVVDFGGGVHAPAWPTDQLVLETLLDAILSPRSTTQTRIDAVNQWLDELPAAVAWVIDDAGQTDVLSGDPLASVGVANLGRSTKAASAADPRDPLRRDFVTIRPGTAGVLTVPIAEPEDRPTARIEIELGDWRTARPILSGALRARPPGVTIGPLVADWTMEGWFNGVASPNLRADGRPAMVARLLRQDDATTGETWAIYVECLRPLDEHYDEPRAGSDWVRLWIGEYGDPDALYRIWRDGRVTDEVASRPGESAAVSGATVIDEGDRWTCLVPIDDALIDGDLLRLGIERVDERARRWSWPQPMLPWQIEPGRVAIDLSTWDGVREASR